MASQSLGQLAAQAMQLQQAGRLDEARAAWQQVLAAQPDHQPALRRLAQIALQTGQPGEAATLLRRVLALCPEDAASRGNLSSALLALGRHAEALQELEVAAAAVPGLGPLQYNLANLYAMLGHRAQAIEAYRRALALVPGLVEAWQGLGNTLALEGRRAEAAEAYQRVVQLRPDHADAWLTLGQIWRDLGRIPASAECLRQAAALRPDHLPTHKSMAALLHDVEVSLAAAQRAVELAPTDAEAHHLLGIVLDTAGRAPEALAALERALALRPGAPNIRHDRSLVLADLGRLDEAAAELRNLVAADPGVAIYHHSLGSMLKEQGLVTEAVACFRRAVELAPGTPQHLSNLLFTQQYLPTCDPLANLELHRQWNERFACPLAGQGGPLVHSRDPDRPLRIGYVSPDLRLHPVGRLLLPVLQAHDPAAVQVTCYNDAPVADSLTDSLRQAAGQWHHTARWSDEALAEQIRTDGIDVLMDLSAHTAGNRLLVFARRVAPVQATWLAYCGTTGVETMDYRLTDRLLDPPGEHEGWYTECSIHLDCYWCYGAPAQAPEPGRLPAAAAGYVTFACLNNFCKVSPPALETWLEILRQVPESRLVLHAKEGAHRQRVLEAAAGAGIDRARVRFVGSVPLREYLELHQHIDVALDPFPWTGGTTTLDSLYMGVPVISLVGQRAVSRGGLTILTHAGLPELATSTREAYVQRAGELAADLPRLAELRRTLRPRLAASRLMDACAHARALEHAWRTMWRRWCGR
jgi:protein O-GlcNAc transferase